MEGTDEVTDNWNDIKDAPSLDRVIVSGWQPPHGSVAGYWWVHEDETDAKGVPVGHPDALLWQPMPKPPQRPAPDSEEA